MTEPQSADDVKWPLTAFVVMAVDGEPAQALQHRGEVSAAAVAAGFIVGEITASRAGSGTRFFWARLDNSELRAADTRTCVLEVKLDHDGSVDDAAESLQQFLDRLTDTLRVIRASVGFQRPDNHFESEQRLVTPKPTMYAFAGSFMGNPAIVAHTEDENMWEQYWDEFLLSVSRGIQGRGEQVLWEGAAVPEFADRSGDHGFRAPIVYPASMTAEQAFDRLRNFAPRFKWVFEESDTSDYPEIPPSGEITVTWTESVPGDEESEHRFDTKFDVTPDMDAETVAWMLGAAAEVAWMDPNL